MELNWYYKNLKQKLEVLKRKRKTAYPEEIPLIDESIKLICDLLAYKKPRNLTKHEFLENEYLNLFPTNFIWTDIKDFAKVTNSDDLQLNNPSITLSNNDLISLIHDFYKYGTNKQTYELFMKLFKSHKTHLHFIREKAAISGDIFYLPYEEEAYIQINRKDLFCDITNTAHEYGHGIQFLTNFSPSIYSNIFKEIVSIFMELTSLEYCINNGIFAKEGIIHSQINLKSYEESLSYLIKEFAILNTIQISPYENKNDLRTKIAEYVIKHEAEIKAIQEYFPSSDYPYVIAYMIAIELFYIYLNDPDYAFYLIYKIIEINPRINQEEYYRQIQNLGININEHVTDYQEHLKRKLH